MRPERLTKEQIAPGEFHCHRIVSEVFACDSAYQRIEVLETEGYGRGLFLDGRVQHVEADEYIYSESMVHPAALALGDMCRRVLCIGGGPGGVVRELLKYRSVERIWQVDIDRQVIEVARRYFPHISRNAWNDPRFELIIADASAYLAETGQEFDLVINDLSEPLPGSPAISLFSVDALQRIRQRLDRRHGAYVSWAGSAGPRSIATAAKIISTVQQVFPPTCHYVNHPQAYGTSELMVIGSMRPIDPFDRTIESIDASIAQHLDGDLRLYDGETHYHMFRMPKDVRALLRTPTDPISAQQPFCLEVEVGHG